MKVQWKEYGGRILLGDDKGCGAVVLRPITLLDVGFWISTGLSLLYVYS